MPRQPGELATIKYTSGSTGNPKGVMISFGAMINAAKGIAEPFAMSREDRMLSYLPLAHAAERAIVETGSLYYGFSVFFAFNLESFLTDLKRCKPTVFFSVPRLWTKFYNGIAQKIPLGLQPVLFRIPILSGRLKRKILGELGLGDVRLALSGSAPLSPTIIAWYRNMGLELLEAYAMTENFAYSHGNRLGDQKVGYVGAPYPGVECRISEQGEVQVKSPADMMGYFKDSELTAQSYTADGFLKTGDMGIVDSDNRLKITGRLKELFKISKGKYVAPVPIENLIAGDSLVEGVCVTGPSLNQPIALIQVSEEGRALIAEGEGGTRKLEARLGEMLEAVNAQLEPHERLDCLIVVREPWTMENGLLTPTMKIKRNRIEAHHLPKAEVWLSQRRKVVFA